MLEHLSTGRDTSSRFYVMLNRCHAEAEPTKFVPDAPTIHRLCTAVNRFAKKLKRIFIANCGKELSAREREFSFVKNHIFWFDTARRDGNIGLTE